MPVLNDKDIFDRIAKNQLRVDPLIRDNVQPGSIDLTLFKEVEVFTPTDVITIGEVDKAELKAMEKVVDISDGYALAPGEYVTGRSAEMLSIPDDCAGMIVNRNSLTKIGIDASISAFANPGFSGRKTIVIRNFGRSTIVLKPGIRICQLVLVSMQGKAIRSYEDRHLEALLNGYDGIMFPNIRKHIENVDDSLSDFLNESITRAASRE